MILKELVESKPKTFPDFPSDNCCGQDSDINMGAHPIQIYPNADHNNGYA